MNQEDSVVIKRKFLTCKSHVPPMFLPSKSQVSPIFCMREMGGKREVEVREKECWRGNRDYYAFRDGYFLSPEVTSI